MDELDQSIENLLEAIRRTEIYKEYRRQEDRLGQDPELKEQVYRFRASNFRLQNEASDQEIIEVVDRIYHHSRELRKNPKVNEYLDAELAMCKLMQRIAGRITEEIDIEVPDIG